MHSQTGNSHLAAAVAAAWPDITVEARVKRAAALALLASPIHSSTASQLAHVVRGSLGSSIKDLGCRLSFQEILQQAPAVFRFTAGPSPHEARIVLNQQGLQYLGQQQQQHSFPPLAATQTPMARASSTSSSAALSPTAVAATAACQGLSFAAVARSPGARILTGPGSASAVSSQQQQRQQQHLQLGAVIDRPPPPPPVAAAAKGSLRMSSARLFDYVSGRTWHADSPQLDTARQALAVFLVQQANPVLSSSTAVSIDPNAYVTTSPVAGQLMLKALHSRFGPAVQRCYKKISDALSGDPYLGTFMSGPSEQSVCLDIHALLLHAASSSNHQPFAASSRALSISSDDSNSAAGRLAHSVGAPSAAAAATLGTTASTGLERGTSSSSAVEEAFRAAAQSLMPPLGHKAPAAATPLAAEAEAEADALDSWLGQDALAAAVDPHQLSPAGAGPAAAGDGSSAAVTGAARSGQRDAQATVSAAAPAATSPPGLPPWLYLGRTATVAAKADLVNPQHVKPAELPSLQQQSLGSSTQLAPEQQQQQQTKAACTHPVSGSEAIASSSSSAGTAVQTLQLHPQPQPQLQHKLLLRNNPPGWYTAEYIPIAPETAAQADPLWPAAASTGGAGSDAGSEDEHGEVGVQGTGSFSSSGGRVSSAAGMPGDGCCSSSQTRSAEGQHGALCDESDKEAFLQLFPDSLQKQLEPYLSAKPGAAPLITQVQLDSGRPVTLRPSDRTTVQLDTHVTLSDALQHLQLLQQRWTSGSPHGRERCVQLQEQPEGDAGTGASAVDRLAIGAETNGDAGAASEDSANTNKQKSSSSSGSSTAGLQNSVASAGPHAIAPAGDDAISDSAAASHNAAVGRTVASKEAPLQPECAAEGPVCDNSSNSGSSTSRLAADALLHAAGLFSAGGCLGVPGSCHRVCAVQDAAGCVIGVTYCLQAAVPGAAGGLADVLSGMKASLSAEGGMDRPRSLLVLGRPAGVGKGCLLRDMCRLMSSTPAQGGLGLHVMMLDTTGDLAGMCAGHPTPHIGASRCLPVPNREEQPQLMLQAALNHRPDVLVVGELYTQQEVVAAVHITCSCNVLLVAGGTASSLSMLLQDSTLCQLLGFELCPILGALMPNPNPCGEHGSGVTRSSCFGGLHRMRHTPFSAAVEVQGMDRWQVHLDLQASSDEAALQLRSYGPPDSHTAATDINTHAQTRSKDADGCWVVNGGSAALNTAMLHDALPEAAALAAAEIGPGV